MYEACTTRGVWIKLKGILVVLLFWEPSEKNWRHSQCDARLVNNSKCFCYCNGSIIFLVGYGKVRFYMYLLNGTSQNQPLLPIEACALPVFLSLQAWLYNGKSLLHKVWMTEIKQWPSETDSHHEDWNHPADSKSAFLGKKSINKSLGCRQQQNVHQGI